MSGEKLAGKTQDRASVKPNNNVGRVSWAAWARDVAGRGAVVGDTFTPLAGRRNVARDYGADFAGGLVMSAIKRDAGVKDFGQ